MTFSLNDTMNNEAICTMVFCVQDTHSASLGAQTDLSSPEVPGVRGGGRGTQEGGKEVS